ncbi:MAG: hypothetical protein WBG04_15625 [Haloferula sp.]
MFKSLVGLGSSKRNKPHWIIGTRLAGDALKRAGRWLLFKDPKFGIGLNGNRNGFVRAGFQHEFLVPIKDREIVSGEIVKLRFGYFVLITWFDQSTRPWSGILPDRHLCQTLRTNKKHDGECHWCFDEGVGDLDN